MKVAKVLGERDGRGNNFTTICDGEPKIIKIRNPMSHLKPKKKKRRKTLS